ncbi:MULTISPECIES: carbohydrate ABC transporter permease [Caproicibacterium]|uniref:Sugar ABC transporter permease n=1 Tax=Caproicibacterium argilliputei TaxID=3030016 RepID=A0AA97DA11_9FIRM|nr:sugar ABC transporter permease [Caproicibacterium argilliputei]WOC31795.1 sugar ABC transporter permease [Caproicibacterium argilliputei]
MTTAARAAEKQPKAPKKKLGKVALKEERTAYLFILLPCVGFLLFTIYPLLFSVAASATDWTGMNDMVFNGFQNYTQLFQDEKFWKSLANTLIYLIGIPIGMILGLLLAMGMNRKIVGVRVLRTMYYIPVISSLVAVSILWAWVYNYDYGLLNNILRMFFHVQGPAWLSSESWVKVAMIIFMVWGGLGNSIVLYLAGLQNIPRVYYEAAEIDGANAWQKFRHITLALISPVTFYILITSLIGGMQVFVQVQVMVSDGGTNYSAATVVFYEYQQAFESGAMGYSCAIAWILALIILVLTLVNFKLQKHWVNTMDE